MGTRHIQNLLFIFFLGASSLTLAQHLYCQKGITTSVEEEPWNTFNWTTGKVDTCDDGGLCQESVLMIKAGAKTALLATKSCITQGVQEMIFVQHTPSPGLVAISYSNYCEDSFCNNKTDLSQYWHLQETSVPSMPAALLCPTCVALGTCFNAPALPCPNSTTRCYHGKLEIVGGGIELSVEVKGCTALIGCKLMGGILTVGPMMVKETCPHQSLAQPRKADNGAPWLSISVWGLELLLPLLLQSLVCFS
ncbi:testis-expressed protein 101 [Tupaia chinensis]|uniref:testis-expressed protein 101 n=1 Tax=Tupaia chinensis TaxID=246437 RepID=UPI0003C90F1A|nr:testis-expressed protein 101 [Tupaia chinensis]XP_006142077.1 testis-expressed protein 101 [Tupaia chinensis]XP_006142078.1 testis-expressed protein 101 [Tupaia chinensis]